MRDLAERMHARIGAPRAARDHVSSPEKALIACGQAPLHRRPVLLHLPADEGRAVIFERELVARHGLREHGPGLELHAAQELGRLHRFLSGALHFREPYRALAAGDRQRIVQKRSRGA